jgi:hypothetical protein
MSTYSFNLSDPRDFRSLRTILLPSLAVVERTAPLPVDARAKVSGKISGKVPQVILPPEFGDPETWTQDEKAWNADMRALLEQAEQHPFESERQRSEAMADVMLRYPTVSFYVPERNIRASVEGRQETHIIRCVHSVYLRLYAV